MNFKTNPVAEGQIPARSSILRVDSTFTGGPTSLKAFSAWQDTNPQLESSPRGLDVGQPCPRLVDLEGSRC